MNTKRRTSRQRLEQSTLTIYHTIIKEAKLTPRQFKIAFLKFRKGKKNFEIASEINFSPEVVRNEIANIYDKVDAIQNA